MRAIGIFVTSIFCLILLVGGIFGAGYLGLLGQGFFAPRYEAIRRDTMVQSRAYSEASTRSLYNLKLQYTQAKNDDERATIASFALHEATSFDMERLPVELRMFVENLRNQPR